MKNLNFDLFVPLSKNFYHRGRNKITESIYILKLSTEHQCLRKGQLYLLYINKSTLSLFVNLCEINVCQLDEPCPICPFIFCFLYIRKHCNSIDEKLCMSISER